MAVRKRLLKSGREKGTVVVEMAIVLPLFLLVIAGVADLGMMLWQQEVLTNAAREGARAAARAGAEGKPEIKPDYTTTSTRIRTLVQNYLRKFNIRDASGSLISLTSSNCLCTYNTTDPATVSVQLKDIPIKMMLLPNVMTLFDTGTVNNTIYLNARTTMAAEWPSTSPPTGFVVQ